MKWKRSKKAQQEAKAKAAEERKKLQQHKGDSKSLQKPVSMNSMAQEDNSLAEDSGDAHYSNDEEEEEIEVGIEDMQQLQQQQQPQQEPKCFPLDLATATHFQSKNSGSPEAVGGGLQGLPLSLAAAAAAGTLQQPPSMAPPAPLRLPLPLAPPPGGVAAAVTSAPPPPTTNLSALLPAHLAKLGAANRLYRPFVA